jgi:hypothetical protein
MNKSQLYLYCTEHTHCVTQKGEKVFDSTILLLTSVGAAALVIAFIDYAISFKKRMKTENN